MYKKKTKEPIFCPGQLEPTWRGAVAGGVLIYAYWRLRVRIPLCTCDFLLAFGALGRKSQSAQKGELCAAALAEVASLGVGRGLLFFLSVSPSLTVIFLSLSRLGGYPAGRHPLGGLRPPQPSPSARLRLASFAVFLAIRRELR